MYFTADKKDMWTPNDDQLMTTDDTLVQSYKFPLAPPWPFLPPSQDTYKLLLSRNCERETMNLTYYIGEY
jgi:hypothetical protein